MQLVFHHYSATEANNMCKGGRVIRTFGEGGPKAGTEAPDVAREAATGPRDQLSWPVSSSSVISGRSYHTSATITLRRDEPARAGYLSNKYDRSTSLETV